MEQQKPPQSKERIQTVLTSLYSLCLQTITPEKYSLPRGSSIETILTNIFHQSIHHKIKSSQHQQFLEQRLDPRSSESPLSLKIQKLLENIELANIWEKEIF